MKASSSSKSSLLVGQKDGSSASVAFTWPLGRRIGVPETTISRWQRDPAFIAELAAHRREAIRTSLDFLTAGARAASGEILAVMRDKANPPSVRLRAACEVLDRLSKWVEVEDLENRIKMLEDAARPSAG